MSNCNWIVVRRGVLGRFSGHAPLSWSEQIVSRIPGLGVAAATAHATMTTAHDT